MDSKITNFKLELKENKFINKLHYLIHENIKIILFPEYNFQIRRPYHNNTDDGFKPAHIG